LDPKRITFTRPELHEKVWSVPVRTLAREFGLSDVGLAKLCRRHQIPVPGRGYWARLQFGQSPKRVALPPIADSRLESIEITRHEKLKSEQITMVPEGQAVIPTIVVAEDRPITHPVVLQIDKSILRKSVDERGLLLARKGRVVPIVTSIEALPRAIRLIDAFFSALGDAACVLKWPAPYNAAASIVVQEEELLFSISEIVERHNHKPTKEEAERQKKNYWERPPKWDCIRTGKLRFVLGSREFEGIHRSWTDGKIRKLETCLGEALIECETMAKAVKKEREDRAESARRRAEEFKREEEARKRRDEYNRKAEAVKKLVQAWHESNLIRSFAVALQKQIDDARTPEESKPELRSMVDWAQRHADYLDPLTDLGWTLRQFKNPPWLYGH